MTVLFWLLVAHAVCDYPLQGDFLARAKNHRQPIPGVPWGLALATHALIHAGGVALVTGSVALGLAEFVLHVAIDFLKCDERTTLAWDQAYHLACKVLWVLLLGAGIA